MPKTMNTDGSWSENNRYPEFCGPSVISSVLGITRDGAARRLRNINPRNGKDGQTSYFDDLVTAVKRDLPDSTEINTALPKEQMGDAWAYYGRIDGRYPTFARFMREHPKGEFILRLSHHFVHVRDGKILEDNNNHKRRGRVTHALAIVRGGEGIPEAVPAKKKAKEPVTMTTEVFEHESLFSFRYAVAPKGNVHRCRCCDQIIEGNAASYAHGMKHVRNGEAVRLGVINPFGYKAADRFVIPTETK